MKIEDKDIAFSMKKVQALTLEQSEELTDQICLDQPNLLASVLALRHMGVNLEEIDFPIHVLMVVFTAMQHSAYRWKTVSEDEQKKHFTRIVARAQFNESLSESQGRKATQQYFDSHPEPLLFAYAMAQIDVWQPNATENKSDNIVALEILNIVECIANGTTEKKQPGKPCE